MDSTCEISECRGTRFGVTVPTPSKEKKHSCREGCCPFVVIFSGHNPSINGEQNSQISFKSCRLAYELINQSLEISLAPLRSEEARLLVNLVTDSDFEDSDRATPPAGLPPQMPRLKLPWEQPPENLGPAFPPHLRSFALMAEIRLLLSTMTRGELMSLPREIRDIVEAFHDSAEELGERALAINVAAVTAAAATTADAASATTAVAAVNAQHPRSYPAQGPVRSKQRSHSLL